MIKKRSASTEVEMFPGVIRRTLNYGESMLLAEISLETGSEVPWHSHPHEQIGYLTVGKIIFEIGDDEKREVEAGDSWLVPSGVKHKVTALEFSVGIDIFHPVRDEYK